MILISVRITVNTVLDSSGAVAQVVGICPGAVAPVVGLSPVADTVHGGRGAATPVEGISPARATPKSTHARAIASAKRLISVSPLRLRNASALARKHDSVNTYKAIDTASRAVTNIRALVSKTSNHSPIRDYLREDSLT